VFRSHFGSSLSCTNSAPRGKRVSSPRMNRFHAANLIMLMTGPWLLLWPVAADLESSLLVDDLCSDQGCSLELLQHVGKKSSELSADEDAKHKAVAVTFEETKANETHNDSWRFRPLTNELSTEAVPTEPPVKLALMGVAQTKVLGPIANGVTGLHIRRNILSFTGRDLALSNNKGRYVYATEGNFFSLHSRTHLYDANTGQGVLEISMPIFAFRRQYELESYKQLCPGQQPSETVDGKPVFKFARLTQRLLTAYTNYDVSTYDCDGSLTHQWDVKSRHWFSMKTHLNFWETGKSDPVGTLDQPNFFEMTPNYDAFVTAGEDMTLFAAVATIMDMSFLQDEKDAAAASAAASRDGRRRRS